MIGISALALVVLGIRSAVERPTRSTDRWAVLGGMALAFAALGFGHWLLTVGIQVFMLSSALLGASDVGPRTANRLMAGLVADYTGLVLLANLQTFDGRAPFDLSAATGALLAASVVALVAFQASW